ncbi:hypothetical protein BCR44DRAFT_53496 [Catenaria anguillulae PL171]|uniref:Zinc finger CCCH domain-containing protein 15 n=1 Tax=Catenaria anguillulae PL171 TaxID=765915 RepID=A0A1Y2HW62_9FUNG|nr:hypothetical protein BCR44DRAFT_53496 [Catenaria anguillulae PL171]
MPPKKENKKQAEAKVKKVVEDKTFGMKNKNKSKKVQKFVEEVKKQAQNAVVQKKGADPAAAAPSKKEIQAQRKAELAEIFKPVQTQKVPFGVDPKTVLCAFFKQGLCTKGAKCKFSHDLNVERKGAKIDVYADKRDQEKEGDTMDNWDQSKLETVISSKHGNPRTTTDIVCKHFLNAIEDNKYGWFWVCPNGGDQCKYRHALPPGYVLKKKDAKKDASEEETMSLEEFLESERHKFLGDNLTPVTLETFTAWKKRRIEQQEQSDADALKAKTDALKAGRRQGLSGRDLFTLDDSMQDGDDDGVDDGFDLAQYRQDNERADLEAEEEAKRQAEDARNAMGGGGEAAGEFMGDEAPRGASSSSSQELAQGMEALTVEDVDQ